MNVIDAKICAVGVVVAGSLVAPLTWAGDLNRLQLLSQSEFVALSEDLGAALSFKPLLPAEPMGVSGFDMGAAVTVTKAKNVALLERATGNTDLSGVIPVPTLRVHKGLPWDVDVGVMVSTVPSTDIKVVGGELRWAVWAGSAATPAVAIRGSVTRLQGGDQLAFDTQGLDISLSKGFAFVTPYVGAGTVRVRSQPQGVPGLSAVSLSQSKVFGGVNLNFGLMNLAFEADVTDGRASYGAKLGVRF